MPEAVIYCPDADLPTEGKWTTLAELCAQAGIPCPVTVPPRRILMYHGTRQLSSEFADAVGVPVTDLTTPEAALRALEALAFSLHDHAARHCVCGRGYFRTPTLDELPPPPPRMPPPRSAPH